MSLKQLLEAGKFVVTAEVGPLKMSRLHLGLIELRLSQVRFLQIGRHKIRSMKLSPPELCFPKPRLVQIGPGKPGFLQVGLHTSNPV